MVNCAKINLKSENVWIYLSAAQKIELNSVWRVCRVHVDAQCCEQPRWQTAPIVHKSVSCEALILLDLSHSQKYFKNAEISFVDSKSNADWKKHLNRMCSTVPHRHQRRKQTGGNTSRRDVWTRETPWKVLCSLRQESLRKTRRHPL